MTEYVPLSRRSVAELRAEATKYREMAAGARTPSALKGLTLLAERLDALVERRTRELAEAGADLQMATRC